MKQHSFAKFFKIMGGICVSLPLVCMLGNTVQTTQGVSTTSTNQPSTVRGFTPFTHNYHSLSEIYQEAYYPDITRENVNLIQPFRDVTTYDYCFDRFNNLYYDDQTFVSIYNKDQNPIIGSSYDQFSVNTSWEAADGFANIPSNDGQYGTNTYYHVFANDINLALYFDPNPNPDIYNDLCTYESIAAWVNKTIDLNGKLNINLSGLLANDEECDNAVLSLLNPMLWDAIFQQMSVLAEDASVSYNDTAIDTIDLSYNNLRIIPNLASIPNRACDGWMFDDGKLSETSRVYPGVNLLMNDEASNRRDEYLILSYADGCIKNINLSHNSLTYFNFYSYRPFDADHLWFPTASDQTVYRVNFFTDYPSLATLCECRYNSILDDVTDFEDVKPNVMGVNLDYNYLPYLVMPMTYYPTDDEGNLLVDSPMQFTVPMMQSWLGLDLPQFYDFDYCLARCYLTYTCNNYYNPDNFLVNFTEHLLGMGAYQRDNIVSKPNEVTAYTNYGSLYFRCTTSEISAVMDYNTKIFNRFPYAQVAANSFSIPQNNIMHSLFDAYYPRSASVSMTFNAPLIHISGLPTIKMVAGNHFWGNDTKGVLHCLVYWKGMYRANYLPSNLHISDDSDLNDIVSSVLSSFGKECDTYVSLKGYQINMSSIVIMTLCFGITIAIIGSFLMNALLKTCIRHNRYRRKKK